MNSQAANNLLSQMRALNTQNSTQNSTTQVINMSQNGRNLYNDINILNQILVTNIQRHDNVSRDLLNTIFQNTAPGLAVNGVIPAIHGVRPQVMPIAPIPEQDSARTQKILEALQNLKHLTTSVPQDSVGISQTLQDPYNTSTQSDSNNMNILIRKLIEQKAKSAHPQQDALNQILTLLQARVKQPAPTPQDDKMQMLMRLIHRQKSAPEKMERLLQLGQMPEKDISIRNNATSQDQQSSAQFKINLDKSWLEAQTELVNNNGSEISSMFQKSSALACNGSTPNQSSLLENGTYSGDEEPEAPKLNNQALQFLREQGLLFGKIQTKNDQLTTADSNLTTIMSQNQQKDPYQQETCLNQIKSLIQLMGQVNRGQAVAQPYADRLSMFLSQMQTLSNNVQIPNQTLIQAINTMNSVIKAPQPPTTQPEASHVSEASEAYSPIPSAQLNPASKSIKKDTAYNSTERCIDKGDYFLIHRINTKTKRMNQILQCKMCDLKFPKLCNLRDHIRIHTADMPFQCTLCGKSFTQAGNRDRHEKKRVCQKKRGQEEESE